MSWKTTSLIISKNLGLFCNTLIADHMYSRNRCNKLPQQLQRYYVKNAEHFLEFLLLFQNLGKIFLILKKKNWIYRLYIPEVIDPAKRGYFNTR